MTCKSVPKTKPPELLVNCHEQLTQLEQALDNGHMSIPGAMARAFLCGYHAAESRIEAPPKEAPPVDLAALERNAGDRAWAQAAAFVLTGECWAIVEDRGYGVWLSVPPNRRSHHFELCVSVSSRERSLGGVARQIRTYTVAPIIAAGVEP